jgi:FkbM family methyltransferase
MATGFNKKRARALVAMLSPARLTRIVDVGANPIEANPYEGLLKSGLCEVWGFEPQEDAFARLTEMAGPHEHYVQAAVGDGSEGMLHVCRGQGYTSLLPPNRNTIDTLKRFAHGMTILQTVPMKTRRLDDIGEVPEFDLLKIDVQGSEVAVFENARARLAQATVVISEVAVIPLYEGQPLLDDQMRCLRSMGYSLHKLMFMRSIKLGAPMFDRLPKRHYKTQMSDGDAVFVRGLLEPDTLTDENLKHLAILADAVFESQDLATFFMLELVSRGVIGEAEVHSYIDQLPNTTPQVEPA